MRLLVSEQLLETLKLKQEVRTVFLDASWAFDGVWHPALLAKLSAFDIKGHIHSWIYDVLHSHNERSLFPSPNGSWSSPHRSVLGPVLFLIYINDFSHALENDSLPFR